MTNAAGHRLPAAPVAAAIALGIAIDRVAALPAMTWGALCAVSIVAGCCVLRFLLGRARIAGLLVLAGCATLGGLRHHTVWSVRSVQDIARYADNAPLVRLTGTVANSVAVRGNSQDTSLPEWRRIDQAYFELEADTLIEDARTIEVAGRVRVDVNGVLPALQPGDRVELIGRLYRTPIPAAEGDFDYRAYLRREGIDCMLRCEHPEAVRKTGRETGVIAELSRLRDRLRRQAEELCRQQLSPVHFAVGESLLLGVRSHLPDETQQAFIESGTMHLLAISGLHVAILLSLVWGLCNLLNLSPNWRAAIVLCTLLGYTLLTDIRPPVLRASILGVLFVLGHRLSRTISSRNLLAVSAIVILLYRPTDLFDAGAQLSFLCVATIIEVTNIRWLQPRLAAPVKGETSWQMIRRHAGRLGRAVLQTWLVSVAIWLAAIPLAAWHFQLLTPIGTLLNVLLVPFSLLVLWPGFLFLGIGMVSPLLASPFAAIFDTLLGCMLFFVDWGASIEFGHFFVPSPPLWWVVGFYALLVGAFTWVPYAGIIRWSRRGLLVWTVLGLLPLPHDADRLPDELRVSFLPVGHGGCVLIECPSGQTIMYDCGSFGDGNRAAQAVFATMSTRGLTRIDALLISHADSDHYNGVIPLLQRVPVGTVCMPRSFLDFDQPLVESTCDAIAAAGTPIRILAEGDSLRIDPEVSLSVLHPPDDFVGEIDNAESLVVLIEYAGRRVLLTGDLEGTGFTEVSRNDLGGPIDVLQSPHHGSPNANTTELREWAEPTWMVVCAGYDADIPRLNATFTDTRVLSTAISGTVTFTIDSGGQVQVDEHLQPAAVVND